MDALNNWTPDDDTYAQRPYRETPKTPIGKDVDTVMVDGVERPARNSNGQHIHPTIEGVRNFWRWFGDSMVVDEQGRPLVVYHGTRANIEQFSNEKLGTNTAASTASLGHFFSNMPFVSERFAGIS